jgi:hypothetical protein
LVSQNQIFEVEYGFYHQYEIYDPSIEAIMSLIGILGFRPDYGRSFQFLEKFHYLHEIPELWSTI